jgi:hypothetical protein
MSDVHWLRELWSVFRRTILFLLVLSLMGGSSLTVFSTLDRVRNYANPYAFDFLGWTLAAVFGKSTQTALGASHFLEVQQRTKLVRDYLALVGDIQSKQAELEEAYGDPDPLRSSVEVARLGEELASMRGEAEILRPIVEALLQEQMAVILGDMGFGSERFVFPPVAFNFAQLPSSLIVSPRDTIRQDANISLRVDLALEEKVALEEMIEGHEDVSALIVPVGGLGTYPTMILESTSLVWITEVIAHEWVHNYLALHPLGWNYSMTPEMRTMNETTASLIGLEVGRNVLSQFYPDLLPAPAPVAAAEAPTEAPAEPPVFDFRAEMRITRLRVDTLLEQGKIEEAENYMEARRLFFWENGYRIRKLNQAYFAFYGAYADTPGGAAGDDPVGEAVRTLWGRAKSPAAFLRTMARLSSYQELLLEIELPLRN